MRIPFLKRIDLYIIGKFLGTYIFSIFLIISIGIVFDYNEHVDKFNANHATLAGIVGYYMNFVPYFSNLFSSLFIFLSVIFFTCKLADNSEIIAMISSGMSFSRLMRPYMISSALLAVITFCLSSEVIPQASVKRLAFENQYKKTKKNPTFADNVQLQVDTGVIAFMEHFDGISKTGLHFSLDKFEGKKLVSHLTARTVVYDTLSDVRYKWQLRDVTIRDLSGMRETITHKQHVDSVIMMEPKDFLFIRNQQETMTNKDLKEYIVKQQMRGSGNTMIFEFEYYNRFASPFAAFILSTIGFSLSAKKRKNGMGLALATGIALSASYILLQRISSTFSVNAGFSPMLAAWFPNIIFSIIAWFLYKKVLR